MRRCTLFLFLIFAMPDLTYAQAYDFAVFGDMPYVRTEAERARYLPEYYGLLESIGWSDAQFVVHVGDYTTGPFCGDSTVNLRYSEFQKLPKPLVFVFGDNDWTDCARGGFDPLERLDKLRAVFAQGSMSLGAVPMNLVRQSEHPHFAKFRENVRWQTARELYVVLNVPGSHNNWGSNVAPSVEYLERNAANIAFLRDAFAIATRDSLRGIGIFIQANPGWLSIPEEQKPEHTIGYDAFLRELQQLTVAFRKPVVLFHGDTHHFRIDKPLVDAEGRAVPNFTRVESYGHPNYYFVKVRVDPADPELFSFRLAK